tara:strand:- start:311 stop:544 length:234 start_codon:yes stop_codon:yes gene_type:complete
LKKKKLTNKERDEAIAGLSNNDRILWKENLEMKQYFSLYLDYRQKVFKEKVEDFTEFVNGLIEEFEKKQRSGNKEGT